MRIIFAAVLAALEPLLLLAQQQPQPQDQSHSIIGIMIGASGGVGFSIWYGWYVTTKLQPKRDAEFTSTIREMVLQFRGENKDIRDHHESDMTIFWNELRAENTARRQDAMGMREALTALTSEIGHIDSTVKDAVRQQEKHTEVIEKVVRKMPPLSETKPIPMTSGGT